MLKKVELEINDDLVQEVIRRYRLSGTREAVHLALRTLLENSESGQSGQQDDEYDEFSDLSALNPQRAHDTG